MRWGGVVGFWLGGNGGLKAGQQKDLCVSKSLEPMKVTIFDEMGHIQDGMALFRKRVFADVIKDVEMASPRMTQVGSTSNGMCPYKNRQREI